MEEKDENSNQNEINIRSNNMDGAVDEQQLKKGAVDSERVRQKVKVIVIGAGASGLGAARWLLDNDIHDNMEVMVFEARERIGGRVYTAKEVVDEENSNALGLFDLGASWLHDHSPKNPMSILAKTMNSHLEFTNFSDAVIMDTHGNKFPGPASDKLWHGLENGIEEAVRKARQLPGRQTAELSLEALCEQHFGQSWRDPRVQSFVGDYDFIFGAPLYKCSATEAIDGDWLKQAHPEENYLFAKEGYASVLEGLVSGEATRNRLMQPNHFSELGTGRPALLSKPMALFFYEEVESITQKEKDGRPVCIIGCRNNLTHRTSEVEADAVILTVPLGVLKAKSITFSPELSIAKQHAIDRVGFGNAFKVVMEFPKIFWATHALFLNIADADNANYEEFGNQRRGLLTSFLNGYVVAKKKILIGYGTGDAADILEKVELFCQ
jgi:polyamine oxidase